MFHYFDKEPRLWRHVTAKRDSWGRDRDFQQTKVYKAEGAMYRIAGTLHPGQMSRSEVERFVRKITSSATFARRWGTVVIEIDFGRLDHHYARGGPRMGGNAGIIRLPKWARTRHVIIHEMAHAVCPAWERHGRLFCRTFVEMTHLYLGKECGDALKASFSSAKVKMRPRRPLPAEQRLAAAERLAACRRND